MFKRKETVDHISNKILKHFSNGLTHVIILWIISNERIHGYGIMKKLDEFFESCSSNESSKTNSSKIYPILRRLEKHGIIKGEWGVSNNKRVKYYTLTCEGEILLNNFKNEFAYLLDSPLWLNFIEDMSNNGKNEVENNEECN
ncbi:PadR family transcriptional regulator [uncultured Methanobrevibacter sp.]|uniref:PadR family transcriptional regulator n=1 Tax=uncultured Methanobrevibacter sp. TaxID=253161 RepID=UPI0026206AC2|nr:PadR family transcriptional regulator [uncultured Methanobrevibacter sp.]